MEKDEHSNTTATTEPEQGTQAPVTNHQEPEPPAAPPMIRPNMLLTESINAKEYAKPEENPEDE